MRWLKRISSFWEDPLTPGGVFFKGGSGAYPVVKIIVSSAQGGYSGVGQKCERLKCGSDLATPKKY
jgi:hypothetical protein